MLFLLVLAAASFAGWRVYQANNKLVNTQPTTFRPAIAKRQPITWRFVNNSWQPDGTPPICPSPLLKTSPVDISQATSILYPGQTRGQYKSYGSFVFGNASDNNIEAKLAMDAVVTDGSRYIQNGSIQFMFEFVNSCGIKLRYDHLLKLSDAFQKIADSYFPQPKSIDASPSNISNSQAFKAGDLVATAIGTPKPLFTATMEFGVYDLRHPNKASKNSAYAEAHKPISIRDFYGICWLFELPASDADFVRKLPGDVLTGKISDYCVE